MLQFRSHMQRLGRTQLFSSQYKAMMLAAHFSWIPTRPKAWKVQWCVLWQTCHSRYAVCTPVFMIFWWNKKVNHGLRADVSYLSFPRPPQGCFPETFFLRYYRKYIPKVAGKPGAWETNSKVSPENGWNLWKTSLHYRASINGEEKANLQQDTPCLEVVT